MTSPPEQEFRSGFVAVMGRPNVGKSTLINSLIGQKIAAVSPKPQTTRHQQLGILSLDEAQIVFIDTPGLHNPHHKLGQFMNDEAADAITDADLILFLVDLTKMPPHEEDRILIKLLDELDQRPMVILALNKIDRVEAGDLDQRAAVYEELLPDAVPLRISAIHADKLDDLKQSLISNIPEGPPFFPVDQITNLYEREIAADLIRAVCLVQLRDEIPHSIAVRMDEYTERGDHGAYIRTTLFVERDSQKGIVVGQGGKMIKRIGAHARSQIEAMSSRKVYLDLRVKVRKNWRNNEQALKQFGFKRWN
ncbi:MAG: GTPase Era [Anaerolineales bacterium]|nr:GTPase Era [Chloroflexota bacterium]MBL6981176.1 GTPase Era [Anaerolineales bacterium]